MIFRIIIQKVSMFLRNTYHKRHGTAGAPYLITGYLCSLKWHGVVYIFQY